MNQLQSFFLGILAAIGALFLEIAFLNISEPLTSFSIEKLFSLNYIFFVPIIIEELLKYAFIYKALSRKSEGISLAINSIIFGLGFSAIETTLVYWNYRNGAGFDPFGLGGIIIIHISTSLLIAYFIGKNIGRNLLLTLQGFILALFFHSSYNILRISEFRYQEQLIFSLFTILIISSIVIMIKSKNLKK